LITTCGTLEGWRSTLFIKVVDIMKELECFPLIRDSMLLTKYHMEVELSILRFAWGTKFDDLLNFPKDEIIRWLVSLMNENEDQAVIAQQKHTALKGIEYESFGISVKQDIIVTSL
jgi:hypothetical protein